MKLSVLPSSTVPAYRQLYDQIAGQILSGELKAGTTLPSIRSVSKELGISVITVRNAWDALLEKGLIESRAGSGCFVAGLDLKERENKRSDALAGQIRELVSKAKELGYSCGELIEMIRKNY